MCCLLIVWLALVSVGANASIASDAGHEAFHTHDTHDMLGQSTQSATATQSQAPALDALTAGDASHADICGQSQCGYGQAAGMLTRYSLCVKAGAATRLPASRTHWASSLLTSNIERPKWPVTTPAVVNRLS